MTNERETTEAVIYYDRKLWYSVGKDGQTITTADQIRELLGDRDLTEESIIVTQPTIGVHEDQFDRCLNTELLGGRRPRAIVIPQRTKYEDHNGTTWGWTDVSTQPFIDTCKKHNIPLYQIENGQIWPPLHDERDEEI